MTTREKRTIIIAVFFFFFFKICFIFIRKSDRRGETERKIFCLMIYFPRGCNSWSCADLKPGARNLLQVSHTGAESQGSGLSSTAFPGHRQGAGWEAGLPGLEPTITGKFKGHLVLSSLDLCDVHIYNREEIQVTVLLFHSRHLDQFFFQSNFLLNRYEYIEKERNKE